MSVLTVDEHKATLGDILHALNHFTWDLERDGWEREVAGVESAIWILQGLSAAMHHIQVALESPEFAQRRYGTPATVVVAHATR